MLANRLQAAGDPKEANDLSTFLSSGAGCIGCVPD
jgi:hypothetical protein